MAMPLRRSKHIIIRPLDIIDFFRPGGGKREKERERELPFFILLLLSLLPLPSPLL